jgi:hypothetical protein
MDKKRKRKRSRKEMKRRKMNAEQPNNTSIICFMNLKVEDVPPWILI